jgi:hypothetical protein
MAWVLYCLVELSRSVRAFLQLRAGAGQRYQQFRAGQEKRPAKPAWV